MCHGRQANPCHLDSAKIAGNMLNQLPSQGSDGACLSLNRSQASLHATSLSVSVGCARSAVEEDDQKSCKKRSALPWTALSQFRNQFFFQVRACNKCLPAWGSEFRRSFGDRSVFVD